MGLYYKHVIQNKIIATEWFIKAASQGNDDAQYELGSYIDAAKRGHVRSQSRLGRCYDNGEGVEQNFKTAFEWYTKAAEQNDAYAQLNLSNLYYKGEDMLSNKYS